MIKQFTFLISLIVLSVSTDVASAGGGKWPVGLITDLAGKKIIKMSPPALQRSNIGKKVAYSVATRNEGPNFDITRLKGLSGTTIFQNNGHGESQFMLAPGSAVHVANLVENEVNGEKPPIAIFGSWSGLFTAKELLARGHSKITIYPDPHEELLVLTPGISNHERGMVIPHFPNASPEMKKLVEDLWAIGFKYYTSEQASKDFVKAIHYIPYYCENRESSGFEPFVQMGLIPPAIDVILDFHGTMREAVLYSKGLWLDLREIKHVLTKQFMGKMLSGNGAKPPSEPIMINCSSFGKTNMKLTQQLSIVLENQPDHTQVEEQHVLFSHGVQGTTLSGLNATRSIYRSPGSLMGTSIHGLATLDNEFEIELLLNLARQFYGISERD